MDKNSFILPKTKYSFKNMKLKTTGKKLRSLQNNIYPYINIDKQFRNKSLIEPKIFKTALNSRKNSLLNSKNNSNSSSINNSKPKRSRFRSVRYITSSMQINKKTKNNDFTNNDNDNFDIDKIEIKAQEDFRLPQTLSKILNKSNQSNKSNKKKDQYIKTENNQKLIFNNVGIHYHRAKNNNRVDTEKSEIYSNKEINKLKSQILLLVKKNELLESEKTERDNKIEALEEKIDKLLNFIKEKKLSGENNEKNKLKNKINNLENCVNYLKSENSELKKEIEKKNKIILSLTSTQSESSPSHKKNVSIGKKKEKGDKTNKNKINDKNNEVNNVYNIDENDIKKIKLISIDPDNF